MARIEVRNIVIVFALVFIITLIGTVSVLGRSHIEPLQIAPGLILPDMDPENGMRLFASKGCVVCHSVNGVGGEHAPPLDASMMTLPISPFEFAAAMWRGAETMIMLQQEELGEKIELTGQELADIIAFVHNEVTQELFSDSHVPHEMKMRMLHIAGEEHEH